MDSKPSYEELERRVNELEQMLAGRKKAKKQRRTKGKSFTMFHMLHDVLSLSKNRNNERHKQTANTLRQSENRFRTAFQTSPDPAAIIRVKDERYIDVNAGFSALTGYTREDIVGKFFREISLLEDQNDCDRLLAELKKNGSMVNMEARFREKNDQTRTGLLSAMIMTMDKDPHVLLVIRDIDRLKKMEEALEVSEARFRELFNSMSSGVTVCKMTNDDNIVIVDINRAAERIEGVKKENLKGKKVLEAFPAGKGLVPEEVLRRVWKTGESVHHPISIFKDNRLLVWKENFVYRLLSGEIIIVCDNITERKKAEEKLLAHQRQLLSLASELSLAEERERRSIATDLHDQIGQTLSVIKIRLHNLREKLSEADYAEQLDEIQEYLTQTIRNTRSLTFELSPPVLYELGLEAAIEWLCEQFQKQHGIQCSYESDRLPKPLGEDVSVVLFRSLRELLANVFKHAKAQSVLVLIRREDDRIRIIVEDNGVGFDISSKISDAAKNHAFGLFNIRERLRHLGGHFELKAEPGKGTRVTLTAPLNLIKTI